jgi:hypothetical protein
VTALTGVWQLVDSRGWDEHGRPLAPPYGQHPMGHIQFDHDRMLAALCNGDSDVRDGQRAFSSYGGGFTFDGRTLTVLVDIASDPTRIGGRQIREVELRGDEMLLRPPMRRYGAATEQRELVWRLVSNSSRD